MLPSELDPPAPETVAELLSWRPRLGILSVYVDADPADRGQRWRIELRNAFDAAVRRLGEEDRDARLALEATTRRVEEELAEGGEGRARGLLGFVEVARQPAEERWYATQLPLPGTEARYARVAHVHRLLELLDDGAPLGIAAVSAERIRLLHWSLGRVRQLHQWELEVFASDWRERKARRTTDPARGEAVSSAGRDQYNQRLEDSRERFAHEAGALTTAESGGRGWRQLLVFGDERYARRFADGFDGAAELRHVDQADVISDPTPKIEQRVERLLRGLNRERERALIGAIKESAYAQGRGSFGPQETLQALVEGRVEHLVYDSGRDYEDVGFDAGAVAGPSELPLIERMIELALSTRASVTPVEAEAAEELAEQGGIAALLRY